MNNYLKSFVVFSIALKTVLTEADLNQQNANQQNLNPVNDYDYESPSKDQDKRTIFDPTIANYGWAKHVGVKPSGHKYVIGYAPVDLKYTPVLRPISIRPPPQHHGYHYIKPKWNLQLQHHHSLPLLRPSYQDTWRPAVPIIKPAVPVVPVHVPPPTHLVDKPWDHYQKPVAVVKPVVEVHPVLPPPQHIHFKPVTPITRPIHPIAVPVHHVPHHPIVPISHHPIYKPFIPSPTLFEVQKPNLGVLPLGATFPSPILHQPHFKPALLPQPLVPQPLAPHPIPQPAYPPGTIVEYHGTHNFLPVTGAVHPHLHVPVHPAPLVPHEQHDVQTPFLPANHPNFFQHPQIVPSQHQFIQQQLPRPSHTHFIQPQQGNPHHQFIPDDSRHNFVQHQQLPGDSQHNFIQQQLPGDSQHNFIQQQVPGDSQHNFLQQQVPEDPQHHFAQQPQHNNYPQLDDSQQNFIHQQQLPHNSQHNFIQPELGGSQSHFFNNNVHTSVDHSQNGQTGVIMQPQPDVSNIQHFNGHHQVIQPGNTDLQLPLHLPNHPHFNAGRQLQNDANQQFQDTVYKPSISLEPPFVNRRSEDEK